MFNKKITKEELEELKQRTKLLKEYSLISTGLELQNQIYVKSLLIKHKLALEVNWEIDLETGRIKEKKRS